MIAAAQIPTSAPGQVVDAAWVGETAIHILAAMEATRAHLADLACPRRSRTSGSDRRPARRTISRRSSTFWSPK